MRGVDRAVKTRATAGLAHVRLDVSAGRDLREAGRAGTRGRRVEPVTVVRQIRRQEFEELGPYIEAVRKFPPLTRKEEHALALRARQGDVSAKQALARHCLAFVVAVARQQRRGTIRLEDLVQEGNVGVMRAAEKFDPHAGTRFTTYAVWWIRAYVGKYLKEARSTVRPKSGAVAQPDLSLDSAIDEDDDVSHLERLEDEGPGPEERYASSESDRKVQDALGQVRERVGELGWDIIHSRLRRDPPDTLNDIGRRWGVSRERVRQVEVQTKRFLRRYLGSMSGTETLREAA